MAKALQVDDVVVLKVKMKPVQPNNPVLPAWIATRGGLLIHTNFDRDGAIQAGANEARIRQVDCWLSEKPDTLNLLSENRPKL